MTQTITLFSECPYTSSHSPSFAGSIVLHCAVIGCLWWGIASAPRMSADVITEHYMVRHLDLHSPQQIDGAAKDVVPYPGPSTGPVLSESAAQPTAHVQRGPQTLIQPDVTAKVTLKEAVPIPTIILWKANQARVTDIVAEQREARAAADVRSSLEPNDEAHLADVNLSASDLTAPNVAVVAGSTSPVVVRGSEAAQVEPSTATPSAAQAAPAAILSISDLKMTDGSVMLPPISESAQGGAPGETQTAFTRGASAKSEANHDAGAKTAAAVSPDSVRPADRMNAADATPASPAEGTPLSATAITLPRNGRFGAVIVGDSVDDEFPEIANMATGRTAYTVYLHVGLKRSWILQYWPVAGNDAAAAGNIDRLDAPWPYNIVRPNIERGAIAADALMVRGLVDQSGHFEMLSVAFPENFPEAQFVLSALKQWQFRPAMQNGRSTAVEVLLIIPEELD